MTDTRRYFAIFCCGVAMADVAVLRVAAQNTAPSAAAESSAPASDAAPMLRLLKSGRVPPERQGPIVNLICQRGGDEELAYVYQRAMEPKGFPPDLRRQVLDGLTTAAQTRKKQPKIDDLDGLATLLVDGDPRTRLAALRLAGAWKTVSLASKVEKVILAVDTSDELRQAALDTLVAMQPDAARGAVEKLLASKDQHWQALGLAALAGLDLDQAALRGAAMLAKSPAAADVGLVLDAFLKRQGGTEKLAAVIKTASFPSDTAKVTLRHLYLAGRSDAALADVLGKAAGMGADSPPPTPEQLQKLVAEVTAQGDAARGETVFRRGDLGCMKCHSVSGAGGDVGPDLSAVGSTSPVDYVITSILHPDLSIKENFLTRSFVTNDGKIYQGIVVDRDDKRVIVKDASGQKSTIATADIDEEVEGRSLMPKGLAGFLTHAEFLDVVRFVSQLGKPGEYAVRSQPTIQRWRYLKLIPAEVSRDNPDSSAVANLLLATDDSQWMPAYAKVAGVLPLEELALGGKDETGADAANRNAVKKVALLRGDVNVTAPGLVEIKLDSIKGVRVWIDDKELAIDETAAKGPPVAEMAKGLHRIVLRVDAARRDRPEIRVVVDKPRGSGVVYTVVGGP